MTRQSMLLAALGAILVVAAWWFALYAPVQNDIASVEEEIAAAEGEGASLQQRVAALEVIRSRAPETEAAIAQVSSIVPDEPSLSGALRQIEAAGEDAGVEISQISITRPAVQDEPLGLYASSVALSLEGSYFQIVDLVRRLEDPEITARGFVLTNLTLSPSDYPTLSGSLNGRMFSLLEAPPEPPAAGAPAAPDDGGTEPDAAATEEDGS